MNMKFTEDDRGEADRPSHRQRVRRYDIVSRHDLRVAVERLNGVTPVMAQQQDLAGPSRGY